MTRRRILLLILLGALLVLVAGLVGNALFAPAPLEIHNLGGNLTQLGTTAAAVVVLFRAVA